MKSIAQSLVIDSQQLLPSHSNSSILLQSLQGGDVSLNLSTRSKEDECAANKKVIFVPMKVLALPGTDKVPFYASPSGSLILANLTLDDIQNSGYCVVNAAAMVNADNAESSSLSKMAVNTLDRNGSNHAICQPNSEKQDNLFQNEGSKSPDSETDRLDVKVNQLLQKRKKSDPGEVIVQSINLTKISAFASQLRQRRRHWRLSQSQLASAVSEFPDCPGVSQSLLCRFEKLDITVRSAAKLYPVLKSWLTGAEKRLACAISDGKLPPKPPSISQSRNHSNHQQSISPSPVHQNHSCHVPDSESCSIDLSTNGQSPKKANKLNSSSDSVSDCCESEGSLDIFGDSQWYTDLYSILLQNKADPVDPNLSRVKDNSKDPRHEGGGAIKISRKRRTYFDHQALIKLQHHFLRSPHPTGKELTDIADSINHTREAVRVWFCNRRQNLSKTGSSSAISNNKLSIRKQ